MDDWQRTMMLPCAAPSVSRARGFVADVLVERGLAPLVPDARVIVSELSTNSVVHARSAFTLGLRLRDGDLVVSVSDTSDLLPVRRSPYPTAGTGRGLLLVEAFSGAWGVQRHAAGGKTVWARLRAVGVEERAGDTGAVR